MAAIVTSLVCCLREEDVTKTMYTAAYDNTADSMTSAANGRKDSKVDLVCDAVREAVEKVDADKWVDELHSFETIIIMPPREV